VKPIKFCFDADIEAMGSSEFFEAASMHAELRAMLTKASDGTAKR